MRRLMRFLNNRVAAATQMKNAMKRKLLKANANCLSSGAKKKKGVGIQAHGPAPRRPGTQLIREIVPLRSSRFKSGVGDTETGTLAIPTLEEHGAISSPERADSSASGGPGF